MTLVRRIAARPSIVFEAVSTADGMASWFGPDDGPVLISEIDPRVGGRFRVRFRRLNGDEHEVHGEILELAPPRRLVMSWCWQGDEDGPGESRLEIELRPITDGATELTLTHADLKDQASADGHAGGWSGALDKLERRFAERLH